MIEEFFDSIGNNPIVLFAVINSDLSDQFGFQIISVKEIYEFDLPSDAVYCRTLTKKEGKNLPGTKVYHSKEVHELSKRVKKYE